MKLRSKFPGSDCSPLRKNLSFDSHPRKRDPIAEKRFLDEETNDGSNRWTFFGLSFTNRTHLPGVCIPWRIFA